MDGPSRPAYAGAVMVRLPVVLACLLGTLLIVDAVLHPRADAPDAYQYMDVAANLAAGRGLVQSVPGYNSPHFPADPSWPQPFTSQPPAYPWLGSLAVRAGMDPMVALDLLAAVGLVLIWLLGSLLATKTWGVEAGQCALVGLALSAASRTLPNRIWSDPLAIAFALATLLALRRAQAAEPASARWALLSGALAGLSFLTRYMFGLLIVFGAAWLAYASRGAARWRLAVTHAVVGGLIALPLVVRNRALTGGWFGEPRNPSTQDLQGIVANAVRMTWGRVPPVLQAVCVCLALLGLVVTLVSVERRRRTVGAITAGSGLVLGWGVAYAVVLIAMRLLIHFDSPGVRLLAPSLVAGGLALCGVGIRWLAPPRIAVSAAVSVALLLASGVLAARLGAAGAPHGANGERSAFMGWLVAEMPPGEVLVAEDAVDLAWALAREPGPPRRFISFSPVPYMRPIRREDLEQLSSRILRPGGAPLRVIVRGYAGHDAEWRERYGDLIADAVAGRVPAGDGLVLETVVSGRRVLRWQQAVAALDP